MSTLFKNLFRNASEGEALAPIIGQLPDFVRGSVIVNGPVGKWDHDKQTVKHWFDGLSLLQSFKVDPVQKTVQLRKRYLRSDAFQKAEANGRLTSTEYATVAGSDPDKNVVSRLVASFVPGEMTDNCACNVFQLGGLTVASTETSLMRVIDPRTLETKEKIDISSLVNIASARAQVDGNGDLYNLAASFLTGLKYHFIKFPKSDSTDPAQILKSSSIVASIPSRMSTSFSYYHSFGMSDNYLVMVEQPWVANSLKLIASKIKGLSFKECLDWYPEEKNQLHIVRKTNGANLKTVYKTRQPFFFLNHVNTFEDQKGNLVVDVIGYDSPEILECMYLDKLRDNKFELNDESKLMRYIVPLHDGDLKSVVENENLIEGQGYGEAKAVKVKDAIWLEPQVPVKERGCEHPSVNPKWSGKPYNYSYVIGWLNSVNRGFYANAVTKVNMATGETVAWRGDEFCHPSEPVFVPGPGGQEDDGVLVSAVTDVRPDHKDFVVFLDARNMTEVARASFEDGVNVSFASHSYFSTD